MGTYNYEGRVYVRPVGRGVVLEDGPNANLYLDELFERFCRETGQGFSGYLNIKLTVEYEATEEPT